MEGNRDRRGKGTEEHRSNRSTLALLGLVLLTACSAQPSTPGGPEAVTDEPKDEPKKVLSAIVWMRSASGSEPRPEIAITADNVADLAADPHEMTRAIQAFQDLGFEVEGAPEAPSSVMAPPLFSITAEQAVFEKAFGTPIETTAEGLLADEAAQRDGLELPLETLSEELRAVLWRVLFSAQPDYHEEADSEPSFGF